LGAPEKNVSPRRLPTVRVFGSAWFARKSTRRTFSFDARNLPTPTRFSILPRMVLLSAAPETASPNAIIVVAVVCGANGRFASKKSWVVAVSSPGFVSTRSPGTPMILKARPRTSSFLSDCLEPTPFEKRVHVG
jgi:hypothetical protein